MTFPKRTEKTPTSVWLDVFDRLYSHISFSRYYPEQFGIGEWYEKQVTEEEKKQLEHITASGLVLPYPVWKFFGTCGSLEILHRSEHDGKVKTFARLSCGSCYRDAKQDLHCLQHCDKTKSHLCPFHPKFDPNVQRSSVFKICPSN